MKLSSRIYSVEVFRTIAVFFVICIHTRPFYELAEQGSGLSLFLYLAVDALCRFAVPFFFMFAGYFFMGSYLKGKTLKELWLGNLNRVMIWLGFWTVVYAVLPDDFLWVSLRHGLVKGLWEGGRIQWEETMNLFWTKPGVFFFESTAIHLWFLIALIMSLTLLTFFLKIKKLPWGIALGVVLFIVALLANPYQNTSLGIELPVIRNARNGPFISTLFVMLGAWFAANPLKLSAMHSITFVLGGYFLSLLEVIYIRKFLGGPWTQDFVMGTVPFVLGIFFFLLAKPDMGKETWFAGMGRYALGIYLSHILVWEVVWNFTKYTHPWLWQILFPFLIFVAALSLTVALKRIPVLSRAVS